MRKAISPLRYPGGKASIQSMVTAILKENNSINCQYIEPYAGGCGLALSLLFDGKVAKLHLNDFDRSIWAFWHSILNNHCDFIKKLRKTKIIIEEWKKQKEIQKNKNSADILELGFSTFFLNRTNRSGIINKAGVIGGINQQGRYKLDCRFNKERLILLIEKIALYKQCINFHNMDAIDFIEMMDKKKEENLFFCIDPPYYDKGATLYTNFYNHKDHATLAKLITNLKRQWLLTYDDSENISSLYKTLKQYKFFLNYSAAKKRIGTELLIASQNLLITDHALKYKNGFLAQTPNSLDSMALNQ